MADPDEPLTLGAAAKALGVSADTLRRWDREGKLATSRHERNRRPVSCEKLPRPRPAPDRGELSTRNRFLGIVEIKAGPHRISAVITRGAIEEMGLAVSDEATALVKAISVLVTRGSG